ncbi:MAG: hypothetical protein M3N46_01805 [Actinomycetota bacterium]|nr:hypothetical protein [Actinomycetota bacterium]
MTPDTDDPDAPDRIARPSGRAILLGVIGVLVAGVAVAVAGFLAGGTDLTRTAPDAVGVSTQSGQLTTFPLHDEKPMKAIGKGTRGSGTPAATSTPAPASALTPSPMHTPTPSPTPTP